MKLIVSANVLEPISQVQYKGFVSLPEIAVVERVMRVCGLRFAGHAAANALDSSLVYRVSRVRLLD